MARQRDIAVVLVKMTVARPTSDESLTEVTRNAEGPMRHYWGNPDAGLRGVAAHNAVRERLGVECGLRVYAAGRTMPKTAAVFRDLCHFTPQGNDMFSRFLASAIVDEMGALPSRQPASSEPATDLSAAAQWPRP